MASLLSVGGYMSKTGVIKLTEVAASDGYTRVHSSGGYGKLNHFAVQNGYAPAPATTPESLHAFESYSNAINTGSLLILSSGGYESATITWTLPAGYSLNPDSTTQRVYWKSMGTSEDLSVNPFDASAPGFSSADAGAATTYTITGLDATNFYAIGVKVEWDDSILPIIENTDGNAYAADTAPSQPSNPLTGGGAGISSNEIFPSDPSPITATQTSTTACTIGVDNVTIKIDHAMQGTSTGLLQYQLNGGTWTTLVASKPAGSSSTNHTVIGGGTDLYKYRMSYNDVSGPIWATMTGTVLAECTIP